MNKYLIRFNKNRGQEGRGSIDHVWRVFENGTEHLAKDVLINVPSWGEVTGLDWNIGCKGHMNIISEIDLIIINPHE
jgi:hypothetical protein